MPVPAFRYPGRMVPVPSDKLEGLLPKGNIIHVRRVYPAEMQPDTQQKWSREFLMDRIREHGAFYSSNFRGSSSDAQTVGIPASDGGFLYILNDEAAGG